jgi:hypothetical protein
MQIKAEAKALAYITEKASQSAASKFEQDDQLIERSVNYFGKKLLKEQINREKVTQLAVDDLTNNPPQTDAKSEIDLDWLDMFSRICESKSNEEIQLFLSKILSGEIRHPGSFSLKTIQTLSLLDQVAATIFQSFCNISYEIPEIGDVSLCLITEPMGSPGQNGLLPVNLNYRNLTQLQDAGLIQYDLTAWRKMTALMFTTPFKIGSKIYHFKPTELTPNNPIQVAVINFTKVGMEIRRVMQVSENPVYNQNFEEWLPKKFHLTTVS